jgi:hypothetical protein
MNKTATINFSSLDFNGVNSLSTYCIDITPLKFIADIPAGFPHRLVWDFGDGTTSKQVSASKIYDFPGVYTVSLIVYDCDTNANISTYNRTILVENYINFTFDVKFDVENNSYLLNEDGYFLLDEFSNYIVIDTSDTLDIVLKCGKISKPFTISSYYPIYQPPVSIFYTINGSNSKNYWDIENNKFSHLEDYHTLYSKNYNYFIKEYQYEPINKIDFSPIDVYAKILNGKIVECLKSDDGSTLVGKKASNVVYIKDDTITDSANIEFKFDRTKNVIDPSTKTEVSYLNNLGITLNYSIIENDELDHLSITSNGLDGEGSSISSFDISNIKFFDSKIPFVVKIKDSELYSVKNFDTIQLSDLNISVEGYMTITEPILYNGSELTYNGEPYQYTINQSTVNSTDYYIVSLNDTLSSQNSGGSFRGYIFFPTLSSDILQNVSIKINGISNHQLSSYNLSGSSSKFNVYKKDFYKLFKKNENFNPSQTLKDLRFQETLLDKNILFEDFLGGILGNENSDHEDIGIKTYEKISNFTQNTQDLDYCELEFLDSLGEYVGYNDIGEERYMYPEKIKRLMNLGSIDKYKLIGITNKFRENLDIRGRSSKEVYGVNIGNQINPLTYIVNVNTPIVALEKFSNQYMVLNTYQPYYIGEDSGSSIYPSTSSYVLSTYNDQWGWALVLPTNFDFSEIEKYYLFFEYNYQYDNTIIGGVIDFDNPKTTISNEDVTLDTFKHMSMDIMYQTLKLMAN